LIGDMAREVALPYVKRAAGLVTRMLPIPQPMLLVGPGSSARLGQTVAGFGHRKLLIVTDALIAKLGLMRPLLRALREAGTAFVVFDQVAADAPIEQVEAGMQVYDAEQCDALLAFGGGSVMDAAKAIGLACANKKHPRELVGYFKGLRSPPPLYAVPTTAGTGSEATVAAVISDPSQRRKLVIADTRLVPRMAALDARLMTGLPPAITAATGMDALTHAVEAYIGQWTTEFTDQMALAAVSLIYAHLPRAVDHGEDLAAREQMALAATYAGMAFTRANVGNVHALAHQLGGWYHTPHGLANAIMLPPVLRFCSTQAAPRLAQLAVRVKLGDPGEGDEALAQKFIDSVQALNHRVGIPAQLDVLRDEDIPALAEAACDEADANYPVPRVMLRADAEALLREVLPRTVPRRARAAKAAPSRPRAAPRKKAAARRA
jgi:alcohol dehydrogenase class IV